MPVFLRKHRHFLCRQCVAVDLPSQCTLCGEAQYEIRALAIHVRRPLAYFFVLQILIHCEQVKEDENADEDAIDKLWHVISRAQQINQQANPRNDPHYASEPERGPPHFFSGLVGYFHQPAKQNHCNVCTCNSQKTCNVTDSKDDANCQNHHRR